MHTAALQHPPLLTKNPLQPGSTWLYLKHTVSLSDIISKHSTHPKSHLGLRFHLNCYEKTYIKNEMQRILNKEDLFVTCNLIAATVISSDFNWTRTNRNCPWLHVLYCANNIHVRWCWTVDGDHFYVVYFCELWLAVWLLILQLREGSWTKASMVSDPLLSPTALLCSLSPHQPNFFYSSERGLQPTNNIFNLSNRLLKFWF